MNRQNFQQPGASRRFPPPTAWLCAHQRRMDSSPFPSIGMIAVWPPAFQERGVIARLHPHCGFIQCRDGGALILFCYSDYKSNLDLMQVGNSVTFTQAVFKGQPVAVEVKCVLETLLMPTTPGRQEVARTSSSSCSGAIQKQGLTLWSVIPLKTVYPNVYMGTVERVPPPHDLCEEREMGCIRYEDLNANTKTIPYRRIDMREPYQVPRDGDIVKFQIGLLKNRKSVAVKILIFHRQAALLKGHIIALSKCYGFIENDEHYQEIFFSYSEFEGNAKSSLNIGDEVEYTLELRKSRLRADCVHKVAKGTMQRKEVIQYAQRTLQGKVVRPMRIVDLEQKEYCGLVQVGDEEVEAEKAETYPYTVTSLTDKRHHLQKGDLVSFQVAKVMGEDVLRATNLVRRPKFIRARVHCVRSQYGYLDYEAEKGKKLFFQMVDVDDSETISPGDEVDFAVVHRDGKYTACSIKKILSEQRPERLNVMKTEARVQIIRAPIGPDRTKGFRTPRTPCRTPTA